MTVSTRRLVLIRLPYLGPESELRIYRGKFASVSEVPEVSIDLGPALENTAFTPIELPPCPDCGSAITSVVSKGGSSVEKCTGCGSLFVIDMRHVPEAAVSHS